MDTQSGSSVAAEAGFRTTDEHEASKQYAGLFDASPYPTEVKLHEFAKYTRRQDLTRLLARYELFKKVLAVKGSVIECGVYHGGGLMTWALISEILEPVNFTRRIYGFDTFSGFPTVAPEDQNDTRSARIGDFTTSVHSELETLIKTFDKNRFLGHLPKVHLVKGDATKTIPEFINKTPHLIVSLLFLDFDLFEPTQTALQQFLPRMPKGSIVAFDELDNPIWPGETQAVLKVCGMGSLRIQRFPFDPYIGYAVIE